MSKAMGKTFKRPKGKEKEPRPPEKGGQANLLREAQEDLREEEDLNDQ